jgi:hypothetical protein
MYAADCDATGGCMAKWISQTAVSFQSVTLIVLVGFCYIRTGFNVQKKKVHKIICWSKLQSFRRIREVTESADSLVMSIHLSANMENWNDYHPNFCWQQLLKSFEKKFNCGYNRTVISQFTGRPKHDVWSDWIGTEINSAAVRKALQWHKNAHCMWSPYFPWKPCNTQ